MPPIEHVERPVPDIRLSASGRSDFTAAGAYPAIGSVEHAELSWRNALHRLGGGDFNASVSGKVRHASLWLYRVADFEQHLHGFLFGGRSGAP